MRQCESATTLNFTTEHDPNLTISLTLFRPIDVFCVLCVVIFITFVLSHFIIAVRSRAPTAAAAAMTGSAQPAAAAQVRFILIA